MTTRIPLLVAFTKLAPLLLLNWCATSLAAQQAKLSVMSTWRAGDHLHVGVSEPDKRFDQCFLFVSFGAPSTSLTIQGVPLVLDPSTAFVLPMARQYGANPSQDASSTYKWRFDLGIPWGVGGQLRLQAALASTTLAVLDVTNGAVGAFRSPGASEMRFAVAHDRAGDRLRIAGMAVDRSVGPGFGTVTNHNVAEPAGLWSARNQNWIPLWSAPPERSPDGRFVVLAWHRYRSSLPYREAAFVYVLDTRSGTGFYLPGGGSASWRQRQARFLPGYSDRLYVLEYTGSGAIDDARLSCYDLTTSGAVLWSRSLDSSSKYSLEQGWSFDSAGRYAHFLEQVNGTFFDSVYVSSFPVVGRDVGTIPIRKALDSRASIAGNRALGRVLPIPAGPNGDKVIAHWWEYLSTTPSQQFVGQDKLCVASGTSLSLPVVDSTAYAQVVAPDGSYALVADSQAATRSRVMDLRVPVQGATTIPELAALALPWVRDRVILGVSADISVAVGGGAMHRVSWDATRTQLAVEDVHDHWAAGLALSLRKISTLAGDRHGPYTRLNAGSGFLVFVGLRYAVLIDAATMTHVQGWDLRSVLGGLTAQFFF